MGWVPTFMADCQLPDCRGRYPFWAYRPIAVFHGSARRWARESADDLVVMILLESQVPKEALQGRYERPRIAVCIDCYYSHLLERLRNVKVVA